MERYVCIHCHFYQPPRENPWLSAIELQDSASPYHDWNERIAAECYAPNAASRILDAEGKIARIVNNYSRISFNFAPTLLSWLEEKAPWTYEQVLKADVESRRAFSGHGSALAQPYNHIILPLANAHDKYTQIAWGIRDFQHRFGRDPEGAWLPETAVDVETLHFLSVLGIKFTILAPHQARRMRNHPWDDWTSVEGASIDPTRAYCCHLPSGKNISLFFYDGPISRAVAFERLLSNGERFANRLLRGFNDDRTWPQLMHIATDGETYGHHHPHGDMALAYALEYVESNNLAKLTNYGEYLEKHPPAQEVEIIEKTSWSCVHGVDRWESDCGCHCGGHGNWNQQWRRPLRQAFNWLRDELSAQYALKAPELLLDPWSARDDYISVVLDRSPWNVDAFLARHAFPQLSHEQQVRVLKLLEMQRHLMLMYTSCGWFFEELTGPETVQVMQYAGRALQLAEELFGESREEEFLCRLEQAWSNVPGFGNGRRAYETFVRPARLDLLGVGAHYAISSLFDGYRIGDSVYCYAIELHDARVVESGKAKLAFGRAAITSRITRERLAVGFAVLHFGDHNLSGGIGEVGDDSAFLTFAEQAVRAFSIADLPGCLRLIDGYFRGATYSLKSLFRDEQRRIVNQIVDSTISEAESVYRQVYQHHAQLMSFLADVRMPLPDILRVTTDFVLDRAVRRALTEQVVDLDHIRSLIETAARGGIHLDSASLRFDVRRRLNALVDQWALKPADRGLLEVIEAVVSLARLLPFEVDFWRAQNVYYQVLQQLFSDPRPDALSPPWLEHFLSLGERLGVVVSGEACASRSLAAPWEDARSLPAPGEGLPHSASLHPHRSTMFLPAV